MDGTGRRSIASKALMRQRLAAGLCLASLALCALATLLWVRGHWAGDVWQFKPGPVVDRTPAAPMIGPEQVWRRQYSIHCGRGSVQLIRREMQETSVDKPGRSIVPPNEALADLAPVVATDRSYHVAGFGYFRRDKQPFSRAGVSGWYWGFRVWTVPYWAVALTTAAPPALWAVRWSRRRRQRVRLMRRQCPQCGYDLRAGHDRCPECGAAVVAAEGVSDE